MKKIINTALVCMLFCVACVGGQPQTEKSATSSTAKTPRTHLVRINKQLPHPSDSYTQGLLVHNGMMYESTGMYGESKMRILDIQSGKVLKEVALPDKLFGEGLALLDNKLYQLTWQEGVCRVYDLNLNLLKTFNYRGEGWGLVAHNDELLMSNGTAIIQVKDPDTFKTIRQFEVTDQRGAVGLINELEMVDSLLYANIYMSPLVAVLDPKNGRVQKYIDCTNLYRALNNTQKIDVFNGIAYDSINHKLYMTGKYWDSTFEVEP